MRTLLVSAITTAAALVSAVSVSAAGDVKIDRLDCDTHPAYFEYFVLTNTGTSAQDVSGWELRSDPEDSERMSLTPAGVIEPGEQIYVVAGVHGVDRPQENTFLWSNTEVLRDGEPVDEVRVYDSSGGFVDGMDCAGQHLFAPTPAPSSAPSPTPSSTAAPQVQAAQSGPADTSGSGGGEAGGGSEGEAGSQAAAGGQQVGGSQAVGAPGAGLGTLAPVAGPGDSRIALSAAVAAAGVLGLALAGWLLRRRKG